MSRPLWRSAAIAIVLALASPLAAQGKPPHPTAPTLSAAENAERPRRTRLDRYDDA